MATATIETTATAAKTVETNDALRQHIASVRSSLALLTRQEADAHAKQDKALQALRTETDAAKRVALRRDAELAGEELAGASVNRQSVENNMASLSKDAAESIVAWLEAKGTPVLEDYLAKRKAALDAAQASYTDAENTLNLARGLHAQARGLSRAVDDNFAGTGATNGPEWAANGVDDMWPTLSALQGEVARLDN